MTKIILPCTVVTMFFLSNVAGLHFLSIHWTTSSLPLYLRNSFLFLLWRWIEVSPGQFAQKKQVHYWFFQATFPKPVLCENHRYKSGNLFRKIQKSWICFITNKFLFIINSNTMDVFMVFFGFFSFRISWEQTVLCAVFPDQRLLSSEFIQKGKDYTVGAKMDKH